MRIYIALLLLTVTLSLKAQTEVSIKTYTTDDGLPSNFVVNMVQDPKGYMWIATHNGLCRFDGYTFQTFSHEVHGEYYLPHSNVIRGLDIDKNGLLWIRFYGDVYSCYDTNKNKFIRYTEDGKDPYGYNNMTSISNGDTWLWRRGRGALRVRSKYGQLTSKRFRTEDKSLLSNWIYFIAEDTYGRIWIANSEGLELVIGERTHTIIPSKEILSYAIVNNTFYCIDSTGGLYKISEKGQVTQINHNAPLSGIRSMTEMGQKILILTEGTSWEYDTRNNTMLPSLTVQSPGGYITNTNRHAIVDLNGDFHYIDNHGKVTSVAAFPYNILHERYGQAKAVKDSQGRIWISTQGNGFFICEGNTVTHHTEIPTLNIFNILLDAQGNIWLALDNAGLTRVTPMQGEAHRITIEGSNRERMNDMLALYHQPGGAMLTSNHHHQVFTIDTLQGSLNLFSEVGDDNARSLLLAHDGTLWVGTDYNGLRIGDKWYKRDRKDSKTLSNNHITHLLEDRKHRVWVACASGGLDLAVKTGNEYTFRHFFGRGGMERKIISLYERRNGDFVVGTDRGVIFFNPDELLVDSSRYETCFDDDVDNWFDVHAIAELRDGRIAYATSGSGLYITEDPVTPHHQSLKTRHFTTADGLPDPSCTSMVVDKQGYLWIGTKGGLTRLNPTTGTFNRFYPSPVRKGNDFSWSNVISMNDGKLVFATGDGLLVFYPEKLVKVKSSIRKPIISNMYIDYAPWNGVIEMNNQEPIHLNHDQNTLTFSATCLDYGSESTIEYSFFLEGHEDKWTPLSGHNIVSYPALPTGSYTLHVKSRNTRGSNDFYETTFSFVIDPPVWGTWWAITLYWVVGLGIIYVILHSLLAQYSLKRSIEMEHRLTNLKSDFFMNISHELRTPLMLIQGSIERLQSLKLIGGDAKQPIKNMQSSTDRLLRLTNQLLTFNKLQNDKLHLHLQHTDVVSFTRNIVQTFSDTASTRRINITFVPQVNIIEIPVDRDILDKILYNLVSNALKFTPDGGYVDVRVKKEHGTVAIAVTDSGVGITEEQKKDLFNRFTHSPYAVDSIGIGLNLSYRLSHLHHGDLIQDDNPDGGCIFTVILPDTDSCYAPEDWATELDHHDTEMPAIEADEQFMEMSSVPLNDRRIVLAEDDPDVRDYLKRELGRFFDVVAMQDGMDALEEIKREKPNLIVSDILMPRMDGIELLKRVRQDDDLFDIPFILLTAIDDAKKEIQGAKYGADSYLPKPVSVHLLTTRCMKLLEQYERLKQTYAQETLTPQQPPIIATDMDRKFREILDAKIEARLSDPSLNVEDLGASMNFRHSQFFARVKEVTGMAPGEYIKQIKMKRATELLADETMNISDVAFRLGFSDPLYFGRCFKQHYGMTPSQYRKKK